MSPSLTNHTVIVTGAGHGVGEAIARALGATGARVAVNDLNPDRAARVAAAIRADGGTAIDVPADVANKFQCVSLVEAARAAWGRLDILINAATVRPRGEILRLDEWDWARCHDVNLKGVFFMCQLAGRVMADENGLEGGVIVNLADAAEDARDRAAYIASQAGILGFTRSCAVEFAAFHVRVHALLRESEDGAAEAAIVRALCAARRDDLVGRPLTIAEGRRLIP